VLSLLPRLSPFCGAISFVRQKLHQFLSLLVSVPVLVVLVLVVVPVVVPLVLVLVLLRVVACWCRWTGAGSLPRSC